MTAKPIIINLCQVWDEDAQPTTNNVYDIRVVKDRQNWPNFKGFYAIMGGTTLIPQKKMTIS